MAEIDLPERLARIGDEALATIDRVGLTVAGAGWLYWRGLADWRFHVFTPLLTRMGRRRIYDLLDQAFTKLGSDDFTILDVHLGGTDHDPIYQTLASMLGDVRYFRISGLNVEGVLIDALIYRFTATPPETSGFAERAFERRVRELA